MLPVWLRFSATRCALCVSGFSLMGSSQGGQLGLHVASASVVVAPANHQLELEPELAPIRAKPSPIWLSCHFSQLPLYLSVTLNPVLLWGYPGEVPPLPHKGAWASQFPANSLHSQAFGNHRTELTCSVPSSFFLSTST